MVFTFRSSVVLTRISSTILSRGGKSGHPHPHMDESHKHNTDENSKHAIIPIGPCI